MAELARDYLYINTWDTRVSRYIFDLANHSTRSRKYSIIVELSDI